MIASKAIKIECCRCNNTKVFHGCDSMTCALNDTTKRQVKRIKAHCLTCIPEQSIHAVKKCNGRIGTKGDSLLCPLHPFRMGKSPRAQAAGRLKAAKESGRIRFPGHQFKPKSKTGIIGSLQGDKLK